MTSPSGYRLEVGPEAVDVLVWEDLLRRAGQAAGDPRGAADLVAQALALWRGPASGDFADEHFAAAEVARLSELHVVALENRAELLLRAGEPGEAVLPLSDLVRAHPFRERPVRLLMLAQHRLGRTVEALDTFQEFRARLADELGLDPSPELLALQTRIVNIDPSLDLNRPGVSGELDVPRVARSRVAG